MANVKISALPSYTGSAADLRWFVMNNSGNTETFKFSGYTTPFKYNDGTNQNIISLNYSNSSINGQFSQVLGGIGNYITSDGAANSVIGGRTSYIAGTSPTTNITGNTIVGSLNSYINATSSTWAGGNGIYSSDDSYIDGTSWDCTLVGGRDNYITNSIWSVVFGGQDNRIYTSNTDTFQTARCAIIGGFNNYITETSPKENSGIFSSLNSYIEDSTNSVIVGAGSSYIQGGSKNFIQSSNSSITNSGNYMAIIGGHNHGINGGNESGIFAGYSNTMTGGQDSAMLGGRGNVMDMGNACCGGNVMMGGESNQMIDSPNVHSGIMGGYANIIRSNSPKSTIIGGESNTISGKTSASIIASSGRTALYDYTAHFDNTHNFKTESFNVIAVGNVGGSIDVDCSLGTIYTFTMTANTTPNFINLRDGQRFTFIVNNSGTFTVPTATVGGVSSTVYAKGGTLNPTNNGYTKYTATYASGILWLDEELNFQAV